MYIFTNETCISIPNIAIISVTVVVPVLLLIVRLSVCVESHPKELVKHYICTLTEYEFHPKYKNNKI